MSIKCRVWPLWPDNNANNVVSLQDNCNNDKFSTGERVFKYFKTTDTFQVKTHLGTLGFLLKTPFKNRLTNLCSLTDTLLGKETLVDKAAHATLIEL